ncbi:MAG: hypothetical protein ACRCV3_03200 [Desulfovibrionaceae bacterium]
MKLCHKQMLLSTKALGRLTGSPFLKQEANPFYLPSSPDRPRCITRLEAARSCTQEIHILQNALALNRLKDSRDKEIREIRQQHGDAIYNIVISGSQQHACMTRPNSTQVISYEDLGTEQRVVVAEYQEPSGD